MRRRLKTLRARRVRGGRELNRFLDMKGRLYKQRMGLRLRRNGHESWLTLKGPRLKSRYIKRLEIQTRVEYPAMRAILKLLGFRTFAKYAKKREEYALGGCQITLDYLPQIGSWFLEIEGRPRRIDRVARSLGLTSADIEKRSYFKLLFGPKSKMIS